MMRPGVWSLAHAFPFSRQHKAWCAEKHDGHRTTWSATANRPLHLGHVEPNHLEFARVARRDIAAPAAPPSVVTRASPSSISDFVTIHPGDTPATSVRTRA